MRFDPERVRENVRQATTEDLLDRVTVYRPGMEPAALAIIEAELERRAVSRDAIEAHAAERSQTVLTQADGVALRCSYCERPAIVQGWGWHWMWGRIPVFPRFFSYCEAHRPPEMTAADGPS